MIAKIKASARYRWYVLISVSLGTFMATLDSSIVNVALPTIAQNFQVDIKVLQWVPAAYILTITSLLLTFGRLADMFGKTKIFGIGFLGFTLGSILCGLAVNPTFLIGARVIQGIGAAMLMANSMGIITSVFPAQERGRALGTVGTVVAAGSMTGPPLGGLLTGTIGWPAIFFINVPIGLLGFWASIYLLPREPGIDRGSSFDFLGAFFWASGVISLVLGLSQVETIGWTSRVIVTIFIGVILLSIFIKMEIKRSQPLIDLNLFKNPVFASGNFAGFISFVTMFFITIFMPFYFQEVKGYEPQQIGLFLMVFPVAMAIVAPMSGYLSDKFGYMIFTTGGMALMFINLLALSRISTATPVYLVVIAQLVIGIAMGMFQSPNNSSVMGVVPKPKLGIAGGIIATMRNFGMVMGIAISVSIFSARVRLYSGLEKKEAFVSALGDVFLVAACLALVGLLVSFIRGKKYDKGQTTVNQ